MKVKQKRARVEGETPSKRQSRATESQIDEMVDYMVLHPHVATGKFDTMHGHADLQGSWEELVDMLNAKFKNGKSKELESWKNTWRDNKTKVSNKFVALKNQRKATGNNPVEIKLTARDEKIISLVGYEYMEGLSTVFDSFPEEHNNVNELLTAGDESILDAVPQATSIIPIALDVSEAGIEIDENFLSNHNIESVDNTVVLESSVVNLDETIPVSIIPDDIGSRPNSSDSYVSHRNNFGQQPSRIFNIKKINRNVSQTSRAQFFKGAGKHHQRLGIQLQDARAEFTELAQRTCEATEVMAAAEMKRAEAALIMAKNDQLKIEILRTMAENDKARNEVMVSLVNTINSIIKK